MLSLLNKLILINGSGSIIKTLAYGAAYHTSIAPNHNISGGAEDASGHLEGELYVLANIQGVVHLKEHTVGGDVACMGGELFFVGRKDRWKPERKTNRATNFPARTQRLNAPVLQGRF